MQAIILAAGMGSRMGPAADGMPKCLLEVGDRPLIEHQLEAFADAGIGPVLVVVGHRADEVRKAVGNRAEYVENTDPTGTNSLFSFSLAREFIKGPVIVANCDLLFHPSILDRLLDVRGSALAYDSSFGPGREKMKVAIHEGNVAAISKDLPYGQATGENVGLICLKENAAVALTAHADAILKAGRRKAWLAEAVEATAKDIPIRGVDIAGLPWIEIDFPFDLHAARKRVAPAIERDRWKRTIRWQRTRWAIFGAAGILATAGLIGLGHHLAGPTEEWNSIPVANTPVAILKHAQGNQHWWSLKDGETIQTAVQGPTPLRVEVRPLLLVEEARKSGEDSPSANPYIIEVLVDGRSIDLTAARFEQDPSVTCGRKHIVGNRQRMETKLGDGPHTVGVHRVAGTIDAFLIRIRESEHVE